MFTQKKLPNKEVLRKYKEVVKEIACTSDIASGVYGEGTICVTYDITEKKVTKEFSGSAKAVNIL